MRAGWLGGALALGLAVTGAAGPAGPQIAAHRGGALLWPENSLTAFRGALGLGADLLELDLHLTKDGELVVIHDATLDRTTTGQGAVRDHTWAELSGVTLRGTISERVPRFREVLELVRPTAVGLLIEIKARADGAAYPGIEEEVLRLLGETGGLEGRRVMVMAFEWDTLERLRARSSSLRLTGLLGQRGAERLGGVRAAAERLAALGANDLGVERTLLTPQAVAAVRAAGLTIGVWTVNEPDELRAALAEGVDYVTTDRPDLALALRKESRR